MITEKQQQQGDVYSMSRDREPSPPSQHEKWKRTRQRQNREYTSDASRVVAEKIISRICYVYICVI